MDFWLCCHYCEAHGNKALERTFSLILILILILSFALFLNLGHGGSSLIMSQTELPSRDALWVSFVALTPV
jgi:hypothetical protein